MKATFGTKQLPKPDAVLADVKAAAEKALAVAEQVVDLTVGAEVGAELVSGAAPRCRHQVEALTG